MKKQDKDNQSRVELCNLKSFNLTEKLELRKKSESDTQQYGNFSVIKKYEDYAVLFLGERIFESTFVEVFLKDTGELCGIKNYTCMESSDYTLLRERNIPYIFRLRKGDAVAEIKDGRVLINTNYDILSKPYINLFQLCIPAYFMGEVNDKESELINKKGEVLLSGVTSLELIDNDNKFLVETSNTGILYNSELKQLGKTYDTACAFGVNTLKVSLNGKYGLINYDGVEVVKPQYTSLAYCQNYLITDNKILDQEGNYIVDFRIDETSNWNIDGDILTYVRNGLVTSLNLITRNINWSYKLLDITEYDFIGEKGNTIVFGSLRSDKLRAEFKNCELKTNNLLYVLLNKSNLIKGVYYSDGYKYRKLCDDMGELIQLFKDSYKILHRLNGRLQLIDTKYRGTIIKPEPLFLNFDFDTLELYGDILVLKKGNKFAVGYHKNISEFEFDSVEFIETEIMPYFKLCKEGKVYNVSIKNLKNCMF